MPRGERGQVTAEYVGALLLVAVIVGALVTAGPAQRIAQGTVEAVCKIAGGDCGAGPASPSVDRQAPDRAAGELEGLRDADAAAVAAFFKGLDPAVAEALAQERPELVGNTDGAPTGLRYRANAEAIRREIARLEAAGVGDADARLSGASSATPAGTAPTRTTARSAPRASTPATSPGTRATSTRAPSRCATSA